MRARGRATSTEGPSALAHDWEKPWLLRFFDQIRFYPVSERELLEFREAFPRGRAHLRIEPTTFRLAEYRRFIEREKTSIDEFKRRQQAAFDAERERWALLPSIESSSSELADTESEDAIPEGVTAIRAQVTGSVWQLLVKAGDRVNAGDKVAILETMKMETEVLAPESGIVESVRCSVGAMVTAGAPLLLLAAS
jgi:urea carboxylase